MCRQAGITRATTIEEAFEAAATFATQPLPAGPRTAVVTTAGGWGVVTADAIARDGDLAARGAARRPARRDRRAPPAALEPQQPDRPRGRRDPRHDPAGARARRAPSRDRRDRLPRPRHPVEPGRASLREGGFYPDHGLERIVAYHERQDARFAQAAADIADATGKPILTATELAIATPDNPGPATVRATGRLCYPSANRAVTALGTPVALRALPPDPRARVRRRRRAPAVAAVLAIAGAAVRRRRRARGRRAGVAAARRARPAPRARDAAVVAAPGARAVRRRRCAAASLQRALAAIIAPCASCVAVDSAERRRSPSIDAGRAARRRVDAEAARRRGRARRARPAAPLRRRARSRPRRAARRDCSPATSRSSAAATRCSRRRARRAPRPRRTRRSPTSPTRSSRAGVHRIDGALVADDSRYDRDARRARLEAERTSPKATSARSAR